MSDLWQANHNLLFCVISNKAAELIPELMGFLPEETRVNSEETPIIPEETTQSKVNKRKRKKRKRKKRKKKRKRE